MKRKKEVDLWCNIKVIRGGRRDGCDRGSDGVIDRRWSTCIITDPEEEHIKIVLETRGEASEFTSRKYRNVSSDLLLSRHAFCSSESCLFIHRCPSPTVLRPPSVCLLSIINPPALRWTPAAWAVRCLRWTRVCTVSPWRFPRRQTAGAWSRWWASRRTPRVWPPAALIEQRSRTSR